MSESPQAGGAQRRPGSPARYVMAAELQDKQILDTSAWNELFDDPRRDQLLEILQAKVVIPTALSISEIAATPEPGRRQALLRLVMAAGQDNRPLAMPNQLMILACQGYARRDPALTLCDGEDARSAWIMLNDPTLVDAEMQRLAREFNEERENIFRTWNESLRKDLQAHFQSGTARPRSMGALIRHYSRNCVFRRSRSPFRFDPDQCSGGSRSGRSERSDAGVLIVTQ
jgi:hypothetical protein